MKFQNYTDVINSNIEWFGNIPSHWKIDRLKWTVQFCKNGVWGEESDGINDIACIRVADFDRRAYKINYDDLTFRSIEGKDKIKRTLNPGDLLIEKSGGGEKQVVGTVVQFDSEISAVCSNFIARMPVSRGFHSRYLTYLNQYLYSSKVNTRSVKQTTGIQNLDSYQYLNELIAYPEYKDQKSIADFLDYKTSQIDKLIEQKEKLLKLLEEKRIALITKAVTKGLDPNVKIKSSEIEWLGEVPEHWEVKRLKFVANPINEKIDFIDNELEYMGLENIESWTGKKILTDEYTPEGITNHFIKNDILFGKLRPYLAKAYLAKEDGICTSEALVLRTKKELIPKYLINFILSYFFIEIVNSSTFGTKMPRASWEFIGSMPILLPGIEEQNQIAKYLEDELNKIDSKYLVINDSIEKLKEYRTSLITSAVTGKIDVRGYKMNNIKDLN